MSIPEPLFGRVLGPYAWRPVALLRQLGLIGLEGSGLPERPGEPPADPSGLAVLLDSAGGSRRLAQQSMLAWRPEAHLWAKDRRISWAERKPPAEAGDAADTDSGGEPAALAETWQPRQSEGDPFLELRRRLHERRPEVRWLGGRSPQAAWVGAYGMVSYDAGRYIERLPDTTRDDLQLPDLDIIFPTRWLCVDHGAGGAITAVAESPEALEEIEEALSRAARAPEPNLDLEVSGHSREESLRTGSNMAREEFETIVSRAREYVWAGDVFQTNLSQRLQMPYEHSSELLYRVLRAVNPSPFAGYLRLSGYELFSSSPERLVRLHGAVADTRPIAGTRRRGRDFNEDGLLADDLNLDPKERAEHIMLVDLERNDLGRVCAYGSVHVDELMVNERYSHVIHIVSNVAGRLLEGRDAVDLLRAMFPGGTITGCPKVRCMEIIDELENVRRGAYTGSFGWFGYGGDMDVNIIIRTLVRLEDTVYGQAGAGIVADSVPENEYLETLSKAEAMVRAVIQARAHAELLAERGSA